MLKSILRKAVLASVILSGLVSLFGAASASAQTVIVERPQVVVREYYGPRLFPRERVIIVPHRYWDARFHCWRYR